MVVPGWRHDFGEPIPRAILAALRRAHAQGARLVSICSGAFLLAATGLLDGLRATTHWRYARLFAERFPRVKLMPDVLYVDEGQLLTSAGSAANLRHHFRAHVRTTPTQFRRMFGGAIQEPR